jgi:hypothetical protein
VAIVAARRRGHLQAVAIAILLAGLLSACSAPVSPTITPTVSEPSPTSEKVVLNCNTVLSDSDAAALTPPLHPIPSFASPVGTLETLLIEHGGQPCGWGAESTASLQVIVAIPFATELTAAKAAAASGEAVDVSQVDAAYFETSDGMGQVQIFMGSYWIDCASSAFTGADQAVETCSLVVSNLRGAGG